ncbi:sigma-70 family RNA polymerase sigma factor [Paenibacillus alginolyticus]|uniref:RNA polymerase sigma factor n=1 Tax=Paenibacillus alginolyticus TaxID=59839 RepID=UPI000401A605|nr:sigma-70 family RNA polymerase sigma factor [Paenibacillus alginolyticus]MCY9666500.1 sigma-70 family RNA polymerase sigma factor [Paenibacillus alginolyticus]
MDLETEGELMDEIRRGDKEAFRNLVNPLIAKAYRSALAILSSKQLAEEAVQNSLIESYSMIMSGKEIHNFRGWFNRVISNRSLDIVRKEQNYKYTVDINELEIEDNSNSPLGDILRKEQSQRLIESVMALELPQRVVVGLYYFQELKIDEIATLLDIKEGTVKSRLYHARLKLSNMLELSHLQTKGILI